VKTTFRRAALAAILASTALSGQAFAANLAIFGINNIGDYYTGLGHTVTYVSDSELSTAGFLDSYDLFVYTRDGYSFGTSLSVAAAQNVRDYVTGNIVLFNGDFSDGLFIDSNTDLLFTNALNYVLSGTGGGYIGEFNGATAAFASNDDGRTPIGLVNGHAGFLGFGNGGSAGDVIAVAPPSNPLLTGVTLPYNDTNVEFGSQLSGYNPARVVLAFDNGNPALPASTADTISAPIPEPATWAMMLLGFGALGGVLRGRRRLGAAFA